MFLAVSAAACVGFGETEARRWAARMCGACGGPSGIGEREVRRVFEAGFGAAREVEDEVLGPARARGSLLFFCARAVQSAGQRRSIRSGFHGLTCDGAFGAGSAVLAVPVDVAVVRPFRCGLCDDGGVGGICPARFDCAPSGANATRWTGGCDFPPPRALPVASALGAPCGGAFSSTGALAARLALRVRGMREAGAAARSAGMAAGVNKGREVRAEWPRAERCCGRRRC